MLNGRVLPPGLTPVSATYRRLAIAYAVPCTAVWKRNMVANAASPRITSATTIPACPMVAISGGMEAHRISSATAASSERAGGIAYRSSPQANPNAVETRARTPPANAATKLRPQAHRRRLLTFTLGTLPQTARAALLLAG